MRACNSWILCTYISSVNKSISPIYVAASVQFVRTVGTLMPSAWAMTSSLAIETFGIGKLGKIKTLDSEFRVLFFLWMEPPPPCKPWGIFLLRGHLLFALRVLGSTTCWNVPVCGLDSLINSPKKVETPAILPWKARALDLPPHKPLKGQQIRLHWPGRPTESHQLFPYWALQLESKRW